jgi:hypothetical protein
MKCHGAEKAISCYPQNTFPVFNSVRTWDKQEAGSTHVAAEPMSVYSVINYFYY